MPGIDVEDYPLFGDEIILEVEAFLDLVSQAYPEVLNVMQRDQAPAHTSLKLRIPENIVLRDQPPHSPELNPIERIWQDLKRDFKGDIFATLDDLSAALGEVLGYLTPDWIAAMTQYPFIMDALSVSIAIPTQLETIGTVKGFENKISFRNLVLNPNRIAIFLVDLYNVPLQRRLLNFASPPVIFNCSLQGGCYATITYRLILNI